MHGGDKYLRSSILKLLYDYLNFLAPTNFEAGPSLFGKFVNPCCNNIFYSTRLLVEKVKFLLYRKHY